MNKSDSAALAALLTRYSVSPKHLGEPGPDDEALLTAFAAALRAPDHGSLIPFRFVLIRGAGLERLAELFVAYARRRGKREDEIAAERTRATQAPVVIAVVARIDAQHEVPESEQWMAVGGAVANVLTALHAQGYAAKMLSGVRARDPEVVRAFCGAGEVLAGWISCGTARTAPKPRRGDRPDTLVTEF
jgi:nitroreductase